MSFFISGAAAWGSVTHLPYDFPPDSPEKQTRPSKQARLKSPRSLARPTHPPFGATSFAKILPATPIRSLQKKWQDPHPLLGGWSPFCRTSGRTHTSTTVLGSTMLPGGKLYHFCGRQSRGSHRSTRSGSRRSSVNSAGDQLAAAGSIHPGSAAFPFRNV